ncbi:hypothetical protein BB561_005149 [Smittium simulii]|uniref:Uncharacterized protein n=1 Tax=Smittium simulii TaxID=133385 RepID=A0A2T9YBX4_9FUNG|nr:hypothetical protein BB561_005149 [Smittium simulii]
MSLKADIERFKASSLDNYTEQKRDQISSNIKDVNKLVQRRGTGDVLYAAIRPVDYCNRCSCKNGIAPVACGNQNCFYKFSDRVKEDQNLAYNLCNSCKCAGGKSVINCAKSNCENINLLMENNDPISE